MPLVSLSEWNQFISKHPNGHVLQSGEWGELKAAFGWQVLRVVSGDVGVQLLLRTLPMGFTLAYLPKPISFDDNLLVEEVDSLCHAKKSIMLKVEQDDWDSTPEKTAPTFEGFRVSPHAIQPRRTIVVDIYGSENEILSRMKQKCRYNIRLAEKKGVTVRSWGDIKAFHSLMKMTGGRDGFGVHSLEYYDRVYKLFHPTGMAEMLVAEFDGKPLAALMVFLRGKRAWYLYGASSDEERNRMPAYSLQWEAMRWAKSKGAEEYDLWGVPDEDENTLESKFESRQDGLWGVYRFKRGFGGRILRAAPALDKVYNPLLYRLYLWRISGGEMG
jgi:lipid II:glycine glycyltransferase (peptidoglycan interpeptide bridge formation enzyme)